MAVGRQPEGRNYMAVRGKAPSAPWAVVQWPSLASLLAESTTYKLHTIMDQEWNAMNRGSPVLWGTSFRLLMRLLSGALAVGLAFFTTQRAASLGIAGLVIVTLGATSNAVTQRKPVAWVLMVFAWMFSGIAVACLTCGNLDVIRLEQYLNLKCAVLAGLLAFATVHAARRVSDLRLKMSWKTLSIVWAIAGALIWTYGSYHDQQWIPFYLAMTIVLALLIYYLLPGTSRAKARQLFEAKWQLLVVLVGGIWDVHQGATAYLENDTASFYPAVLIGFILILLCKLWFRLPDICVHGANTAILLIVGLPVADLIVNRKAAVFPPSGEIHYTYAAAKGNRAAFEVWWNYFWKDWNQLEKRILMSDPDRGIRYVLRPGSGGKLVQSEISINSKGFRGAEISAEKGDAYRLVVIGESSTFGLTRARNEKTWPEMLAGIIEERLKPSRRIEVINAGVPGADLQDNLRRFKDDILPLKPDLIVCYHGYNGFHMLDKAVPRPHGQPPPVYVERPLKLLADCEYRLRLISYNDSHANDFRDIPRFSNLMETRYAQCYRELIEVAQTNAIQLAVANFSMAVTRDSPREVVEFLMPRHPRVYLQIAANEAHTKLIEELVKTNSRVCFVDTQNGLNGKHDKFIDLMHPTEEGDQQLAENCFVAIRQELEQSLVMGSGANTNRTTILR